MDLISQDKTTHPGLFQKKLIEILRNSSIKKEDKKIMALLRRNSEFLKELEKHNKYKKTYFVILFLFLFIVGSILFYLENIKTFVTESVIISQVILFILILVGTNIYVKIIEKENKIQTNLLSITTQIGDKKSGR